MGLIWLLKSVILFTIYKKICMVPYETTVVDSSTKGASPCEDGWIHHDEYCYKLEKEKLDWLEASGNCRTMDGFLATVHSKEQNDILKHIAKESDVKRLWIGLHDQDLDGIYSWNDNSIFNYSNWLYTEPSGSYESEGFLEQYETWGKNDPVNSQICLLGNPSHKYLWCTETFAKHIK